MHEHRCTCCNVRVAHAQAEEATRVLGLLLTLEQLHVVSEASNIAIDELDELCPRCLLHALACGAVAQ